MATAVTTNLTANVGLDGVYRFWINPATNGGVDGWTDTDLATGNYTIRVRVNTPATGSNIDTTFRVTVYGATVSPPASIGWTDDSTGTNIVNAASATAGTAGTTAPAYFTVTDDNTGFPMVRTDDSFTALITPAAGPLAGTPSDGFVRGSANRTSLFTNGVYAFNVAATAWEAGNSGYK
ncbi:MAG: hypothetical protein B7C55_03855, partial [Actinomycetales bacterium mxb001]